MTIISMRPKGRYPRILWNMTWGPASLLLAFIPLLICNLLQFPSLLVLPFSGKAYRAYNRLGAFLVWGYWAWGMRNIIGMKIIYSGDDVPPRENAIVYANHQEMSDIIVLIGLAMEKGRVADLKWMVKDIIKYVPGIGWGMLFLDCLFLKRNWADDEANIKAAFMRFIRNQIPLWMVSFPEGTRATEAKIKSSQDYARSAGVEPMQHVLLPRSKGFAATVLGLRDFVQSVYSVTIMYEGSPPKLTQMIRGDVERVHVHVKRFPIAEMPMGERDLGAWLLADFYRKDALIGNGR